MNVLSTEDIHDSKRAIYGRYIYMLMNVLSTEDIHVNERAIC